MKKIPLAARLCLQTAAISALIVTVFRTIAMFVAYDQDPGYFVFPISLILTTLSVVTVLSCIVLSIITPKDTLPKIWPEGRSFHALIPAAFYAIGGLWSLILGLMAKPLDKMLLLLAVFALLSSFYYIATALRLATPLLVLVGFAPVVWGLIAVVITYTDQYTTMNSPIKLGLQFGFLSIALTMLAELRFLHNKATPRSSLCFHCFAVFFGLTSSIPTLAYLIPRLFDPATAPPNAYIHTIYALVLLGSGIYATLRLISYTTNVPADAPLAAASSDDSTDNLDTSLTE